MSVNAPPSNDSPRLTADAAPASDEAITRVLASLARRERGLVFARAALASTAGWAGAWALLTLGVDRGWITEAFGGAWISLAVLVGVVAGAVPLLRLDRARGARRHAVRVEELRPELRGALLAAVDRAARPMGSPALLARLARRAADVAASVPPTQVYPRTLLQHAATGAAAGALALLTAVIATGRGPADVIDALLSPMRAQAQEVSVADGPRALVGDITLRYLFPTYTRREPLEIANSNGEIHAPPGTRVEIRARTAEAYPRATLRVYDAAPEPVEALDGRDVRAALTIAGAGVWRFEFDTLPSPDYRIVPEPDLPPDVSVQAARGLSVAMDKAIALPWTARDDYGLRNVQVEVTVGGSSRLVPARTLLDVPRSAADDLRMTPAELGLSPGDVARLRVGAWDNDEVSGSKPGWSAPVEVEVLGARGRAARQNRYRLLLRDALVRVLADFLVEPSPAVAEAGRASGWAAQADGRYAAFDSLVQEAWGGSTSDTFDATLVRQLNTDRRTLFAYARGLGAGASARELNDLASLQEKHVASVENAVLMLDEVLRGAALQSVSELVQQIADEAGHLESDLPILDARSALARLDQLERLFAQMVKQAAELDEGALKEFVNDRSEGAQALMKAIREAIAAGRMDEAQQLMQRLAKQMQSMRDDLEEMQQRRQQQSDDLGQAMAALKEELQTLEQDQRALRERTEQARERFGGDLDEAQEAWAQAEKLAEDVTKDLATLEEALGTFPQASYGNRVAVEDTRAEADGLYDSTRARDLETAVERTSRLAGELAFLSRRVADPRARAAAPDMDAPRVKSILGGSQADVQRIEELLEQLRQQQSRTSPQLARELQELAQQQRSLAERSESTAGKAGQIAKDLPMDAPGLEDGTRRAAEQGQRAARAMAEGDAMSAEGGQRAAEDGLREAREALDEAQRNLQQMQQAQSGSGEGEGEEQAGKSGGSGDGEGMRDEDFALPAPEAFRTPEEYRRALLEGMSGEVPEEYKALNRRYYEELVRQ